MIFLQVSGETFTSVSLTDGRVAGRSWSLGIGYKGRDVKRHAGCQPFPKFPSSVVRVLGSGRALTLSQLQRYHGEVLVRERPTGCAAWLFYVER
jgi:hypothetical protein